MGQKVNCLNRPWGAGIGWKAQLSIDGVGIFDYSLPAVDLCEEDRIVLKQFNKNFGNNGLVGRRLQEKFEVVRDDADLEVLRETSRVTANSGSIVGEIRTSSRRNDCRVHSGKESRDREQIVMIKEHLWMIATRRCR